MPISIYSSLQKRKIQLYEPLVHPEVKIYVCGPTVYDEPHIGHARSAYIFDLLRRYLKYRGYRVKFVRNITDVDDKIIEKARKELGSEDINSAIKKVSAKYLDLYHQALAKIGISNSSDDPDIIEPKASEYIDKMVSFIEELIGRGVAYESSGDVYFDIKKAPAYGKLSNQSLDHLEAGARISPGENKNNPLDFALWKKAKDDEPSWPSPWSQGRPGWHIECSVMSTDILGDRFDIHGGGIDLIFPHHENEIAQAEGLDKGFANIWMHHGLLSINGQKMAKSLGNFVTVGEFLYKYKNADLLKLIFLSGHYSQPLDFTDEKIEEAKKAYERIDILMHKFNDVFSSPKAPPVNSEDALFIKPFKEQFIKYMNDDLNTPRALAVLFEMINACNKFFESEEETKLSKLYFAREAIKEITAIFGLGFLKKEDSKDGIPDKEVERLIKVRAAYKSQKRYFAADEIRKDLEKKGIILEDTKEGKTTWRKKL
ncbi:MAG: cysteine--tRNA ligase [Candidatus Omnitrophota bacterium]|nr:MAG: cysteine--tRNA ligase [Candidatus Omnitrophota bacterium]